MKIVFTVPGIPAGKMRPRFARRGKFVTTYQPEKDANREELISIFYRQAAPGLPPHDGAVSLKVTATFLIPKSWSKKQKADPGAKTSKPDLDNIVKSVKDGLNRVAWLDDAQVINVAASKHWGAQNGTIIEIERL